MNVSVSAGSISGLLGGGVGVVSALAFTVVSQQDQLGPAGLNFADYEKMKSFPGGICVNTYLNKEEKVLLNKASVSGTQGEWNLKLNYKFTEPKGEPRGCVAIAWDKETWENDKWKGTVRYEWLFTMGPETLVSYGLYNSEEDTIKWKSIYVNKEKLDSDGLLWEGSEKPPKPKFSDSPALDFDQICKKASHECKTGHKEKDAGEVKWTWEGKAKGSDKFSDWSKNFSDAFNSLNSRLGTLNSQGSKFFSQLVEKKGVWTRR